MYQVNIDGTANVVNIALENGVKRFIHLSSVAALGRTTKAEMINEEKNGRKIRLIRIMLLQNMLQKCMYGGVLLKG